MCIRASLPRVSVNVFFSNERCTLLLWTIIIVPNLQLLEQKAESIFDELNNSHIDIIQRAVLHMKVRAQQCLICHFYGGNAQILNLISFTCY